MARRSTHGRCYEDALLVKGIERFAKPVAQLSYCYYAEIRSFEEEAKAIRIRGW